MKDDIQRRELRFIEQRNQMIKEQMNSLKRLIEQTIDDFKVLKTKLEEKENQKDEE